MHTIPNFPTNWIKRSNIRIQEGCYPTCLVIRPWTNEMTPFVVHMAIAIDGKWSYECGNYCRDMARAEAAYEERVKAF
jgi:hypothetical protein